MNTLEYKKPTVEEIEQNVHLFKFEDRELYLIGTAHVSKESIKLVEKIIAEKDPDTICIELDDQRLKVMKSKDQYENLDIIKILKTGQMYFFIANLFLSSFQKKIAEKTGSPPGEEFKVAMNIAEETNKKLVLVDRNIGVTLKRAWRLTGFWGQIKLMATLIAGEEPEENSVNELSIEELKDSDVLTSLIEDFSKEVPVAKRVLIDERDTFMTGEIQKSLGEKTVAVVGAGHVPGMIKKFENKIAEETLEEIKKIPEPNIIWKLAPWVIPLVIFGIFAWGFSQGNIEEIKESLKFWVLANGVLTAIGCLAALAHPLTIVTGFIAAPITSLNPTIGAGFVTSLVQALLVRPRVKDVQNIQEDASSMNIKVWWKNRLIRVLMVFVFSSIGSAIGTFVALPALLKIFN